MPESFPSFGFGFGGETPRLPSARSLAMADAILHLIRTSTALDEAKAKVPSYTGQWDNKDYYANELEDYYRACEALEQNMAPNLG
jgi:hypothetical protein